MRTNWNPLMDGEWKLDGFVVEGEHAVEWVHEDLNLRQGIRISNSLQHARYKYWLTSSHPIARKPNAI